MPTSTSLPARVGMFQPTLRPAHGTRNVETSWGDVTVIGKLGQQHANLLELMMFSHIKSRNINERLQIMADPHQLRVRLSNGTKYSYEQFWKLLHELEGAVIDIKTSKLRVSGHIIDEVTETDIHGENVLRDPRKFNNASGVRSILRITFGQVVSRLIEQDIGRFYNPQPITALQYGISMAIVRHCLTHIAQPNGGWILNNLLEVVQVTGRRRERLAELREDATGLLLCGFGLNGNRLMRAQTPQTRVQTPPKFAKARPDAPEIAVPLEHLDLLDLPVGALGSSFICSR